LIYDIEPYEINSACRELEGKIPEIASGLLPYIGMLVPGEVEVDLRSEKLGLSGRLDRLAPGGIPSLIRSGKMPEDGVWKRDRLMLAGYSLLLNERYAKNWAMDLWSTHSPARFAKFRSTAWTGPECCAFAIVCGKSVAASSRTGQKMLAAQSARHWSTVKQGSHWLRDSFNS